ncbi:MAG: hypothetical protein LAO79_25240, partial [Acidobacteriia bacterium]|nr:hypothetical protein [Terriglobia bacterium]
VGRNNRCLWKKEARYAGLVLVTALGAGAFGGFLVQRLAVVFCHWTKSAPPLLAGLSRVATWGTPLLVLIVLLTGVLHIGLMGLPFVNQRREWWARLSGWLLIGSLAWTLFFAISIYAPFGVIALSGWVKSKTALIGAWVLSTLSGVAAGKSAQTSGKKGANSPLELVAVVAPYVFVAGLLVAISYGIYYLVPPGTPFAVAENRVLRLQPSGHIDVTVAGTGGGSPALTGDIKIAATTSDEENLPSERDHYWERWEGRDKGVQDNSCAGCKAVNPTSATSPSLLARWVEKLLSLCRRNSNPSNRPLLTSIIYWFLGLSVVVLVLAWRVDINEFSMHLLYRNRLVRCYLGASNEARDAQRFTGFDPADDVLLKNFRADKGENYGGPYPIISSTLNVTHGEKLAWQERKAESFVFTPMYCGYEFVEEHDKIPRLFRMASMDGGYCPTESYAYKKGGVYLGTAFAISGAAASPNMGYHTSAALAFLMTIFNVRLGWWLGNPRRGAKEQASPYFSLLYLLFELFANTSDRSQFIYVSDGGHFENLGIYELVRRGCKYIVASDAGADANMKFGDLGNAIRKCRSDFGVEIELNADAIRPATPGETSTAHYAVGTIHYPGTAEEGKLLYIKSSIAGEEPEDVLAYKACHPEFPHQTTADQWFDESQFESYRALGRFVMESALERLGEPDEVKDRSTEDVFNALASH